MGNNSGGNTTKWGIRQGVWILSEVTVYTLCVIDLLIVYSMCNSVLSVHTAMLYLGQVAVVNENLFSTSLPG